MGQERGINEGVIRLDGGGIVLDGERMGLDGVGIGFAEEATGPNCKKGS